MTRRTGLALTLLLFVAFGLPENGRAQGAASSTTPAFDQDSTTLKPGQYLWAPELSPNGPVTIYVDLGRQLASVYRNGVRIGAATISSGRRRYETPAGTFTILERAEKHFSRKYDNAPMPFMQRLTWDGVALHGGAISGRPSSHGCIRLPHKFARLLFGVTRRGDTVTIVGEAGVRDLAAPAGMLAPASASIPLNDSDDFYWRPELAPEGPVTVVASRASQRVAVLRNGVEIGGARIAMPDGASSVLTLSLDASGQRQWTSAQTVAVDPANEIGAQIPRPFRDAVEAILAPGDTVVVTSSALSAAPPASQQIASDASSGAAH